ncbi:hypothetical protein KY290_001299 [Solanum tuberosum]|uniref:Uncharacterized protein n=1 Tax=Solanum tuberosum TaxID=4113 RepID=A0ABQ7WLQ4_SOLTU|nr:hypothetical protein KY290_001299 [Solanum tuberosum]
MVEEKDIEEAHLLEIHGPHLNLAHDVKYVMVWTISHQIVSSNTITQSTRPPQHICLNSHRLSLIRIGIRTAAQHITSPPIFLTCIILRIIKEWIKLTLETDKGFPFITLVIPYFLILFKSIALNNILHVPSITNHLLSVQRFARDNDVFFDIIPLSFLLRIEHPGRLFFHVGVMMDSSHSISNHPTRNHPPSHHQLSSQPGRHLHVGIFT